VLSCVCGILLASATVSEGELYVKYHAELRHVMLLHVTGVAAETEWKRNWREVEKAYLDI
jgi:hypothetical protein